MRSCLPGRRERMLPSYHLNRVWEHWRRAGLGSWFSTQELVTGRNLEKWNPRRELRDGFPPSFTGADTVSFLPQYSHTISRAHGCLEERLHFPACLVARRDQETKFWPMGLAKKFTRFTFIKSMVTIIKGLSHSHFFSHF